MTDWRCSGKCFNSLCADLFWQQ